MPNRVLAYHRYLQRDRAQRIAALQRRTAGAGRRGARDRRAPRRSSMPRADQQRAQLAALAKDRRPARALIAELDQRYQDRSGAREGAGPRCAVAASACWRNLRAAAARAEAERRAEPRAARSRQRTEAPPPRVRGDKPRAPARAPRPAVASAPALQVGGLGWPLSGSLLAALRRPHARRPQQRRRADRRARRQHRSRRWPTARVVFADWMTGYGLILIVDHGNGYMSLYAHNDACCATPATGSSAATRWPASAPPAARARRRCISNCAATASRSIPRTLAAAPLNRARRAVTGGLTRGFTAASRIIRLKLRAPRAGSTLQVLPGATACVLPWP